MFLPHTAEALLSHSATAQFLSYRHRRAGRSNMADAWDRATKRMDAAATRMLVGRPATAAVAAAEGVVG